MESRQTLDSSDWKLNSKLFRMLEQEWGPFDVDLFAARHNTQLPRFFSFRPDPQAEAVDALSQSWTNLCPYAFPPIRPDRKDNTETQEGEGTSSSDNRTNMAEPTLVPINIGKSSRFPDSSPGIPRPSEQPSGRSTSSCPQRTSTTSRLEGLRNHIRNRGLSDEALQIITASWRPGTEKSYSSAWKKWSCWCSQ